MWREGLRGERLKAAIAASQRQRGGQKAGEILTGV